MSRSNRFCFTWNNYPADYAAILHNVFSEQNIEYLVFGRETAPTTGTLHLQGFVIFSERRRINAVRGFLPGCHVEVARGTTTQAVDYCKKDADFEEYGTIPVNQQGRRSDIETYTKWLVDFDGYPTEREVAVAFAPLYMRYRENCLRLREFFCKKPELQVGDYRDGWQTDLALSLDEDCTDDRKVIFYVDEEGGKGKSWFIRKFISDHIDFTQYLSIGKRDDLAFAIDETKSCFLFNIPRGQMEFLSYPILEMLKDRMIFSTKYQSRTKVLATIPHVIVFSNEMPDEGKLTVDRYDIRLI